MTESRGKGDRVVSANELLGMIRTFCRQHGMAETTFGRCAVNDGKFVGRVRDGARIRPATLRKVQEYMARSAGQIDKPFVIGSDGGTDPVESLLPKIRIGEAPKDGVSHFRFFDNRQKYLLFVNTCSEKTVVAKRVGMELSQLQPRPPAMRIFDAGVGDGTVLSHVLRDMHRRFSTMPFYVAAKEVSLEDVRLTLAKMPDRFFEHPAMVLVLTNMHYAEAPWFTPKSSAAAGAMVWREVALEGSTAHEFETQIEEQNDFLSDNWGAHASKKTGNPLYDRPAVLVMYREDYRFLMDDIIPRRGAQRADYDLVIASQPYRLRASNEFKASKVLAPLARSLAPGGRLLGIHSHGYDPGMEIIQAVWGPDENPFTTNRQKLLSIAKTELGRDARNFKFNAYSDKRSIFRYDMHTLPTEINPSIGTSTLFAAWNAAIYVAQIEEQRLSEALADPAYLRATQQVLERNNGLWFNDESYVISRDRT
jgi:SAM-dependent methyltransferase